MIDNIFSPDHPISDEKELIPGVVIEEHAGIISSNVSNEVILKGDAFANEIKEKFVSDFEKNDTDKMVHVSTFALIDGMIYMTYYANCKDDSEDPNNQTARLVYCPLDDLDNKVILDIQSVGDECSGKRVNMVYDTIFAQIDPKTLIVLWTAMVGSKYYRLYRLFDIESKTLGDVGVNRFQVGEIINDFSTTGIKGALSANGIGCKKMYSDIGIMQKFTQRTENGAIYYYTGAYSGDFNCVIKSRDFITWEYVSQPSFLNLSKWENAVYVLENKLYYFVRQHDTTPYGFLTCYDIDNDTWETPVLVEDCQSRSDFIMYRGELYLFHAPIDREHIGVIKINTEDIAKSHIVLQANMQGSCFYPYIQYLDSGELAMSYTVSRKHIRLARFELNKYI